MKKLTIFTLLALLLLGSSVALAASGYLIVPDHFAGVVGNNEITVTATGLEADFDYLIVADISYHANPRTPPPIGESPPPGYTETFQFFSNGSDVTHTFIVPLPDCNWQFTAGFTLYFWNGTYWIWNGDELATQTVDVWSDCEDGDGEGEGCTPGYWKNHLEDWGATGYLPSDDFDTTFGVDLFNPDITLEEAVNAKGGGDKKLARHGTAALLSAAHPDVDYPYSVAEVIAFVQAGDVDPLVVANELGCIIP